jgi:hypothetical protein
LNIKYKIEEQKKLIYSLIKIVKNYIFFLEKILLFGNAEICETYFDFLTEIDKEIVEKNKHINFWKRNIKKY